MNLADLLRSSNLPPELSQSIRQSAADMAQTAQATCEARYRGLFDSTPHPLWEMDFSSLRRDLTAPLGPSDGSPRRLAGQADRSAPESPPTVGLQSVRLLAENRAARELRGVPESTTPDAGPAELWGGRAASDLAQALSLAGCGASALDVPTQLLDRDGRYCEALLRWSVVTGCEDDWERCLVTMAEPPTDALSPGDPPLNRFLDALPLGVHLYDLTADGHLIFRNANRAGRFLGGVDCADLLGLPLEAAFPAFAGTGVPQTLRRVAQDGHAWSAERMAYGDGRSSGAYDVLAVQTRPGAVAVVFRDVTERRRAEEALASRVRALTQPAVDVDQIAFEDLFDLDDLQHIQDMFAAATGVASIITRTDGTPICKPSRFCRLCSDIIRKTETGLRNCYHSDAMIGRYRPDGPVIQPCLSGGLWDAGASITVGGTHVANWLIGQVRDETQTEERMRQYAREIGADEGAVVEAFREVPTMSRERFGQVAETLFALANYLSATAYQNVLQARFIREREQAEAALRDSEERWQFALEGAGDGVWDWDLRTNEVYFSPQWKAMLGYADDEIPHHLEEWDRRVHPDDKAQAYAGIEAHLAGRTPLYVSEHRLLCRDGRYKWILVRGKVMRRADDGTPLRFVGIHSDLTDRRRAEGDLRASEERLRLAVETGRVGYWEWDVAAGRTTYGGSFDDITGTHVQGQALGNEEALAIAHPDDRDRARQAMHRLVEGLEAEELEFRVIGDDGAVRHVLSRARALRDATGKVTRVVGATSGTTERKRAEDAQRLAAIGQLAAGVAHEFNNLLAGMMMWAERAEAVRTTAVYERLVEVVLRSTTRGAEISGSLATFARTRAPRREVVDVVAPLEAAVTVAAKQIGLAGIELVREYVSPMRLALADPDQLEQVFLNLIINACQAMPDGGRLTLAVTHEGGAPGSVVTSLSDTGIGIPPENLPRVLEPFFTTKGLLGESDTPGVGLGLSVSHGIVTAHGGTIEITSQVGIGTTVRVSLSAHEGAVRPPSEAGAGSPAGAG